MCRDDGGDCHWCEGIGELDIDLSLKCLTCTGAKQAKCEKCQGRGVIPIQMELFNER